jgi:hypothetical protein
MEQGDDESFLAGFPAGFKGSAPESELLVTVPVNARREHSSNMIVFPFIG